MSRDDVLGAVGGEEFQVRGILKIEVLYARIENISDVLEDSFFLVSYFAVRTDFIYEFHCLPVIYL